MLTNVNVGSSLQERKVCECVAVRRPGRVETAETRNDHRLFLVWVYFEHERFESGFRDLTLCVKVLRGSGACVLPELRLTVVCLTPRC